MLKHLTILLFVFTTFAIHSQDEFRLERVKTIPDNATVNDILVHKEALYVATNVGLYKIDTDDLETRLLSKKNIDAVTHVVKDEIWASVDGKYIQNMSTGETTNYNSPGLQVRDLEYAKGKIWIATNQGILTVLTRTNELGKIVYEKKSGLPSNEISFIHIDDQKQMWIGTDKGIVFINAKDKWKTYEKKLSMEAMHYNHEGLWLVSNEEMWVVDPYNRWYPAAIDKGLRKGKIRDITADSTGRLYMASEILVRYDPYDETIESYAENTAIVSKVCTQVESDRDNRIWLGTKEGGLFLFGYADQARTIEEMVVARDKKMEGNNEPSVEIAIVEPLNQPETVASGSTPSSANSSNETVSTTKEENTSDAIADTESSTASVASTSGVSRVIGDQKASRESDKTTRDSQGSVVESSSQSASTVVDQENSEESSRPQNSTSKKVEMVTGTKINILAQIESDLKCNGDLATVNVILNGGNPPYKVIWSDGTTDQLSRQLPSGNYKLNVSDKDGQSVSSNIIIKDVSPLALSVLSQSSPTALDRKDGQTKVKISGGAAPYNISWENGESGDKARRLEGGLDQLTITDQNNCELVTAVKLKGARILPELQIASVKIGQKLEIKNIYYEADSTDLSDNSFEVLDEIYEFLEQNKGVNIEIGGHTNNLPPDEYCDNISTARAKSVTDYLYAKGITEDRITYIGYGKRNPIASNTTKEGRKRNQRVEIKITSIN
ncbi:OmpA family protein [Portibacter lacus]|uniref:OmpA-like domain-containing protein n=1 Tax=Portibacter lacus TaxID=1099794 RepID=A0AA37SPI7_9BACT|nr:OmpA family protein [Portibacter lacus]GLR16383.1 hypothetical protein GCM10007940_09980 [Portibacter lacus]